MSKIKTFVIVIVVLYLVSLGISVFIETDVSDKVVILPLYGTIVGSSSSGGLLQGDVIISTDFVQLLKEAQDDETVKGVILEINSPGGTVLASKEVAQAVKQFEKPIVAWIREMGTSGAYWVASAADVIIADELSITGSISVLSSYLEFSELFENYGVTYQELKTGEYKDIMNPFKELTEKEHMLIQKKLDIIHDTFVTAVADNRDLDKDVVEELASGIFYLGTEAKQFGLIDKFGGKELAKNITKKLANLTDANFVVYKQEKSFYDMLSELSQQSFFFLGRGIGSEFFVQRKEGLTPRV